VFRGLEEGDLSLPVDFALTWIMIEPSSAVDVRIGHGSGLPHR
jgi:hypothetical protein